MTNTEKRTKEQITKEIIEYFENNTDLFNACMEELDGYNGYLGDDRYYPMDELDELYSGANASEILARAFYGYDEESWYLDNSGNKVYSAFNPNRDYFRYNGYGNLVSSDYIDYSDHLDFYAVRELQENRRYIDTIDDDIELSNLFDELDDAEE